MKLVLVLLSCVPSIFAQSALIGPAIFTGSGLNDATSGGTFLGSGANSQYTAVVTAGTPDTVTFSRTSRNGTTTPTAPMNIVAGPMPMIFPAGSVTAATCASGRISYTDSGHGLSAGAKVTVAGATSGWNVVNAVVLGGVTSSQFSVAATCPGGGWVSGGTVTGWDGPTVTWAATTGHTSMDKWQVLTLSPGSIAAASSVGAGVGAIVTRSAQDRLNDVVDVQDYAKCNGGDDTDGLRLAVQAVYSIPSVVFAKHLYFPPGSCRTNDPLTFSMLYGLDMFGAGWQSQLIYTGTSTSNDLVQLIGQYNPHIHDMVIGGDGTHNFANAIHVYNVSGATVTSHMASFDHLWIRTEGTSGNANVGIFFDGGCAGCVNANNDFGHFDNVQISGPTFASVEIAGSQSFSHQFYHCFFYGHPQYGLYATGATMSDPGVATFTWDGGTNAGTVSAFYSKGATDNPDVIANIDEEMQGAKFLTVLAGTGQIVLMNNRINKTYSGTSADDDTEIIHNEGASLEIQGGHIANYATSGGSGAPVHIYSQKVGSAGNIESGLTLSDTSIWDDGTTETYAALFNQDFGSISSASWSAGVATYTVASTAGMADGLSILQVNSPVNPGYNASNCRPAVLNSTQFSCSGISSPGSWISDPSSTVQINSGYPTHASQFTWSNVNSSNTFGQYENAIETWGDVYTSSGAVRHTDYTSGVITESESIGNSSTWQALFGVSSAGYGFGAGTVIPVQATPLWWGAFPGNGDFEWGAVSTDGSNKKLAPGLRYTPSTNIVNLDGTTSLVQGTNNTPWIYQKGPSSSNVEVARVNASGNVALSPGGAPLEYGYIAKSANLAANSSSMDFSTCGSLQTPLYVTANTVSTTVNSVTGLPSGTGVCRTSIRVNDTHTTFSDSGGNIQFPANYPHSYPANQSDLIFAVCFSNICELFPPTAGGTSAITGLTGDVTATGPGNVPGTLSTVGSAGSCGTDTNICKPTFDSKGRETAQSTSGTQLAVHGSATASASTGVTVACTSTAVPSGGGTPTITCTVTDPGHSHTQN